MANTKTPPVFEAKKYLRVATIAVLTTVILSRLCYALYSATYYNTMVSDAIFTLIYHLCNTMYAASRGVAFAVSLCAFFLLGERKVFGQAVLISAAGTALFHLSAFFADVITGLYAKEWLSLLLYNLLQIVVDLTIELLVLVLILYVGFRKRRGYEPIQRVFSLKNPPQAAALIFSLVYLVECLGVPVYDIASYLSSDSAVINGTVILEIVTLLFEAAMTGFVIPYAIITFVLWFFAPKKQKN